MAQTNLFITITTSLLLFVVARTESATSSFNNTVGQLLDQTFHEMQQDFQKLNETTHYLVDDLKDLKEDVRRMSEDVKALNRSLKQRSPKQRSLKQLFQINSERIAYNFT